MGLSCAFAYADIGACAGLERIGEEKLFTMTTKRIAHSFSPRVSVTYVALAMVAVLACALFFPFRAFASYNIPSVHTSAQIQTNGSLHVVQQQAFSPSEEYAVLTWRFTGLPNDAEISVASVRVASIAEDGSIAGDWVALPPAAFQSSWRDALAGDAALTLEDRSKLEAEESAEENVAETSFPQELVWSLDKRNRTLYIFDNLSSDVLIECDYTVENAVYIYEDVAEFYWDYITPNDEAEIENVDVTIALPVPDGIQVVDGENVLAWGHGPKGSVEVTPAGTITYLVPQVKKAQYAQAHIIFPQGWLNNIPRELKITYTGLRKDAAVSEEATWTDTWSNRQTNSLSIDLAATVLCFVILIGGLVLYAVFGRDRVKAGSAVGIATATDRARDTATTKDPLFRYGAPVIGRFVRWNNISTDDFIAELMDLARKDILRIERAEGRLVAGTDDTDRSSSQSVESRASYYCNASIHLTPRAKEKATTELERQTLHALFDVFADGYQVTSLQNILEFAKKDPDGFVEEMDAWQSTLSEAVVDANLFDTSTRKARKAIIVLCIASLVFAAVANFVLHISYIAWIFLISGIVLAILANYTKRYSQNGCLLRGSLDALEERLSKAEAVDGAEVEPYTPLLFAAGDYRDVFAKIVDPTPSEDLWLSPVTGRGGKPIPCLAAHMSDMLRWALKVAGR